MDTDEIAGRREAFERWHRNKFRTRFTTGQPTRDLHNGVYAEQYGPEHQQWMWEAFNAAADLYQMEVTE
ncbi:hypothetical protein D9M70_580220 [compost metagenome]